MPRTPWDPRAVSDPGLVIEEFPDDLVEAGRKDCRRRRRATGDDDLVPLDEVLRQAQVGEQTPSPELPGMPRPGRRLSYGLPSDGRELGAIDTIQRQLAVNCIHAGPMAFLRGLSFLHRVLG